MSAASGVGYSTICNIERGKHRPQFRTINKLAKVLGVEPNFIDFDSGSQIRAREKDGGKE